MQSKTYTHFNPETIADKIKSSGGPQMDFTQTTGQATDSTPVGDVTLGWVISNGQVVVNIIKKPFLVPASTVWEHVDALFA